MRKDKTLWRKGYLWKNEDGEFGQQTGTLLKIICLDKFGNIGGISRKPKDWLPFAKKVSGLKLFFIKIFGKQLCNEKDHGCNLYAFFGLYSDTGEKE